MEAANCGARAAGAPSVGLGIDLPFEQDLNEWVDHRVDFHYFFTRKIMFVRYASAFVVLPGGFGTMDELFEAATLIQTRKIRHFPIVLVGHRLLVRAARRGCARQHARGRQDRAPRPQTSSTSPTTSTTSSRACRRRPASRAFHSTINSACTPP